MVVVAYGGGVNSTAMLIWMHQNQIPVDLILFADTGCEQPHTYEYLPIMNGWLTAHGMPEITVVEYVDRNGDRLTLEQECLRSGTLPALAYGHKKCSLKHNGGGPTPSSTICRTRNTEKNIRSSTAAGDVGNASPPSNRRACRCPASPPVFSAPL